MRVCAVAVRIEFGFRLVSSIAGEVLIQLDDGARHIVDAGAQFVLKRMRLPPRCDARLCTRPPQPPIN
jgi:hypothetical protein